MGLGAAALSHQSLRSSRFLSVCLAGAGAVVIQALTSGARVTIFRTDRHALSQGAPIVDRGGAHHRDEGRHRTRHQPARRPLHGGRNVVQVVRALVSAQKAKIPLAFGQAAAIDLAGRDVLEAVKMSVLPKVITTPKITAMAKDGISSAPL